MAVVRDICSLQRVPPASLGGFQVLSAEQIHQRWGEVVPWHRGDCVSLCWDQVVTARGVPTVTVLGGETSPSPWTWPPSASDPEGLAVLGLLSHFFSLFDPPSIALSFPTVFLTKNVNKNVFSLLRYSKGVYLASSATLMRKLFYPPSFFLFSAELRLYRGGTGNFVFQNQFSRF